MAYIGEAEHLIAALRQSRRKLTVFVLAVLALCVVLGSRMYLVEGERHGFTSIPRSNYWTIVTLTTVGYGDISPQTNLGQTLAAIVMLLGYAIIAVPTGTVTAEITRVGLAATRAKTCEGCGEPRHDTDARYCKRCGAPL